MVGTMRYIPDLSILSLTGRPTFYTHVAASKRQAL